MKSSEYIEQCAKNFALYTIQDRAIPLITDGLKPSQRRNLWTARNGEKIKTATLGGLTMAIHPHGQSDNVICGMTAPYDNNIPYFKGDGAFGTLLNPKSYGASRYTSVSLSKFSNDVIFKDFDILEMKESYDGKYLEPVEFYPLIPLVLLNGVEGISYGYNVKILPRDLEDIIKAQINYLKGKKSVDPNPTFYPYDSKSTSLEDVGKRSEKLSLIFKSLPKREGNNVRIVNIPYGTDHESLIKHLYKLKDGGIITDYEDESKDSFDILVKFPRGSLKDFDDEQLIELLDLKKSINERLIVIDFNHEKVVQLSCEDLIKKFTDWRLGIYIKRFNHLINESNKTLVRLEDFQKAYSGKLNQKTQKVLSRKEVMDMASKMKIVNLDYIVDLPIHRFTEESYKENEKKILDVKFEIEYYKSMLDDESKRKELFVQELNEILKNFKGGKYK